VNDNMFDMPYSMNTVPALSCDNRTAGFVLIHFISKWDRICSGSYFPFSSSSSRSYCVICSLQFYLPCKWVLYGCLSGLMRMCIHWTQHPKNAQEKEFTVEWQAANPLIRLLPPNQSYQPFK
jgi:hypothetical protein